MFFDFFILVHEKNQRLTDFQNIQLILFSYKIFIFSTLNGILRDFHLRYANQDMSQKS